MAIDKQKAKVIVDLENSKLLQAPDYRLTLREVSQNNMFDLEKTLSLNFQLNTNQEHQNLSFFVLSDIFTDGKGETFNGRQQSASTEEYSIYIDDLEYENPLTFKIQQYPLYLEEEINIRENNVVVFGLTDICGDVSVRGKKGMPFG